MSPTVKSEDSKYSGVPPAIGTRMIGQPVPA